MVIGGLGVEGQPGHERDRVGKAAQRELLANAHPRPASTLPPRQLLVDLFLG